MATAGVVAAKNPQIPGPPRFSPVAQAAIAGYEWRSGFIFLWASWTVPRIRSPTPSDGAVEPFETFDRWVYGLGDRWAKFDREEHLAALIRAEQPLTD